jgi:HTH-type transcriptional regulator / antitoxin HipB
MDDIILNPKDLGLIVRDARKAQGLSQDDLAGITGTGRRFIGDLEGGKPTAQLSKVLHVLSALGVALNATQKWRK